MANEAVVVPRVPMCCYFLPDDKEIILEFLRPKIRGEHIERCALNDIREVDLPGLILQRWDENRYPYFRSGEFWFFLTEKTPVMKKGVEVSQVIVGTLGKWKYTSKSMIINVDRIIIGMIQKMKLVANNGLQTGWRMIEYNNYSTSFQTVTVCHLIFNEADQQF